MQDEQIFNREVKGWVKAEEWVSVDDVEFINISEGVHGEDIMEFVYEQSFYSSPIYAGYKPSN